MAYLVIRDQSPSFYRFKNCSRYNVNVYWRAPSKLTYYNCLAPKEFLDVNTFVSHIWVFVNDENGNRLLADGCYEFSPRSWRKEVKLAKEAGFLEETHEGPIRKLIKITNPLHSLTYLAMEVIRDTKIALKDVNKLEIPLTLQSDLRKMILRKCCVQGHKKECICKLYLQ